MSRITSTLLALVLALALVACTQQEPEISVQEQVPASARQAEPGGDGEDGEDGGEIDASDAEPIEWESYDLGFEGPTEMPAGAIALTLVNVGNLPHDITIEELGNRTVVDVDGGETDTAVIELEPGEYTFYCSVPGHRSAMEEIVTVS
jgi:plastocyanin